jgi:hypothetical protein
MLNFYKKALSYIITGSCSIVFAACYGPPARMENPKQLNAKNGANEPIQGLKVTLFENRNAIEEQFTNKSGSVDFYFAQKENYVYSATIEDVDGSLNGEYKSKNVDFTKDSFIEIKLEDLK